MDFSLDNQITAKVVKAAVEFDMINNNDRIAVGLSGGKDSMFLCFILKLLQSYSKKEFNLKAVYVDPGFSDEENKNSIQKFAEELDLELQIIETKIADYIKDNDSGTPCSKCALFRKGAVIDYMKNDNLNKLAFGHHLDDAVETFLLSIFYSGQIKTLQPKRYLSENQIDLIRPLIYLRESTIQNEINKREIKTSKSSCPYDSNSARTEVRRKFADHFEDDILFSNLISAMRKKENIELWPEEIEFNHLKAEMKNFWK